MYNDHVKNNLHSIKLPSQFIEHIVNQVQGHSNIVCVNSFK